jgi:hypothetical protein
LKCIFNAETGGNVPGFAIVASTDAAVTNERHGRALHRVTNVVAIAANAKISDPFAAP